MLGEVAPPVRLPMSLAEFDIIRRYFTRRSGRADVPLGVGDDAAVLELAAGRRLVLAVDTMVEDVHFPAGLPAADIGYRVLAANLSDMAAMGAQPAWMTLSLSLPHAEESWLDGFAAGLFELADRYEVALVGGDTVRGPLVVSVQIAGWVEADRWLTRAGAQPGDALYMSGVPGEAAAGLALLREPRPEAEAEARALRERFLRPQPRVALGRMLRPLASAAMDISDGLLADLDKLCAASGCGAELDLDALPASAAMQALFAPQTCLDFALAGGEDFELLFTVPEQFEAALLAQAGTAPGCTRIGRMVEGAGVRCWQGGRRVEIAQRGYVHFAS